MQLLVQLNGDGNKMQIVHVISGLAKASGPTKFCVRIVDHLAYLGEHVFLYVEEFGQNAEFPSSEDVSLNEFGSKFCIPGHCDVMHVHAMWIMSSHRAIVYARKNRIPCVVSPHGMLAPWTLSHKWWKKKIAWWLYQRWDLKHTAMFHVTAPCEIEWLRKLGFKQPCVLAPLGSELPDASFVVPKHHDIRRILFVGRVYPVKGLVNLVRAFSQVKNAAGALGTWQVVIAGPNQAGHMGELIALGRKLGLTVDDLSHSADSDKVTTMERSRADIVFTGGVYGAVKDALYPLADLFVLPSFTESFGVVVTEALAYGLPVITTQGTPWQELETEDCGWWVALGVEPLKIALRNAMDLDDAARHQMGLRGMTLVSRKYVWPVIAWQMKQAYKWLVDGGDRPDAVFL